MSMFVRRCPRESGCPPQCEQESNLSALLFRNCLARFRNHCIRGKPEKLQQIFQWCRGPEAVHANLSSLQSNIPLPPERSPHFYRSPRRHSPPQHPFFSTSILLLDN